MLVHTKFKSKVLVILILHMLGCRKKILEAEVRFIRTCNRMLKITNSLLMFVGPLFCYVLVIDGHNKCLDFNHTPAIVLSVLRSILGVILLCVILCIIIIPKRFLILPDYFLGSKRSRCMITVLILLLTLPMPQVLLNLKGFFETLE